MSTPIWTRNHPREQCRTKRFPDCRRADCGGMQQDAISHVKMFGLDGKLLDDIKLPTLGKVAGVEGEATGSEAFIGFQSYTVPPTILRYEVASKRTSEWAKVEAPIDSNQYDVKQVWFNSKDGTRVPMFVVSKKGLVLKRQESHPADRIRRIQY